MTLNCEKMSLNIFFSLVHLQVVAMESIESISKHNSGAVWAVLCCLVTKRCLSRPGLKSIEVNTV